MSLVVRSTLAEQAYEALPKPDRLRGLARRPEVACGRTGEFVRYQPNPGQEALALLERDGWSKVRLAEAQQYAVSALRTSKRFMPPERFSN